MRMGETVQTFRFDQVDGDLSNVFDVYDPQAALTEWNGERG